MRSIQAPGWLGPQHANRPQYVGQTRRVEPRQLKRAGRRVEEITRLWAMGLTRPPPGPRDHHPPVAPPPCALSGIASICRGRASGVLAKTVWSIGARSTRRPSTSTPRDTSNQPVAIPTFTLPATGHQHPDGGKLWGSRDMPAGAMQVGAIRRRSESSGLRLKAIETIGNGSLADQPTALEGLEAGGKKASSRRFPRARSRYARGRRGYRADWPARRWRRFKAGISV